MLLNWSDHYNYTLFGLPTGAIKYQFHFLYVEIVGTLPGNKATTSKQDYDLAPIQFSGTGGYGYLRQCNVKHLREFNANLESVGPGSALVKAHGMWKDFEMLLAGLVNKKARPRSVQLDALKLRLQYE